MNLSDRFGFGRRKGGDADDAIFLADDRPAREDAPGLKPPQVRAIHRPAQAAAPAPAEEAPYPSRTVAGPPSLLDRFGLSRGDRRLADQLFGDPPAAKPAETAAAPKPAPAIPPRRKKMERSDFMVGALGVTLGLTCALFPWYIFFNQEKFGVREFVFEGSRGGTPPAHIGYQPQLVGRHFQTGDVPRMDLDFFPTATVTPDDEEMRAVPASQQPFPADLVNFRLVHVANGRAMIQDEDGLWIVQPGSRLPDASKVASIEQRDGGWVLVTSQDRVVRLEQ